MYSKIFVLLFTLFLCTSLFGETFRYRIEMMGSPVGTAVEVWKKEKIDGRCILSLESNSTISVVRGRNKLTVRNRTLSKVECDSYKPISFLSTSTEGGFSTKPVELFPATDFKLL